MRVLMLSWEYPPHIVGGLGKHVTELTPALSKLGIEIDLLTPALAGGDVRENLGLMTIHRVPVSAPDGDILDTARAANMALSAYANGLWTPASSLDIIHVHDWLLAECAHSLRERLGAGLVATLHATERGRLGGHLSGRVPTSIDAMEHELTREADRIIVTSQFMRGQVRSDFGIGSDKIDVVPNGVDPARFADLQGLDLSEFRRSFAAPAEQIVLYVGRLEYQKGVHILLEAVPEVRAHCPQAAFVVAGTGHELESLEARAVELGVDGSVQFTGYVDDEDRDRLYQVADLAVFPSLYEPFGIVALEAMASRCPVVVSDVGGLSEVVTCNENGLTVYPGDPGSVAWGIVQLLTRPDLAQSLALAAYRVVQEQYNWSRIARLSQTVYQRALKGDADD